MTREVDPTFNYPDSMGFCGGVKAAVDMLDMTAGLSGDGVSVVGYHAVVHNAGVTAGLEAKGVRFTDDLTTVEPGSAVVVSAHGAGPEVFSQIRESGSEPIDATCPLVIHTHKAVELARQNDEKIIYVCEGNPDEDERVHDEVAGMVGHLDSRTGSEGQLISDPVERAYIGLDDPVDGRILRDDSKPSRYRVVTQTTLNADRALRFRETVKERILELQPDAKVSWSNRGDVCRAVSDRQAGVEQLVTIGRRSDVEGDDSQKTGPVDTFVVVTDPTSKNGGGYVSHAQELLKDRPDGSLTEVLAVENADHARRLVESGKGLGPVFGITASASTPDETIRGVVEALGGENPPQSMDRTFNLRDARPGVLKEILARLKEE